MPAEETTECDVPTGAVTFTARDNISGGNTFSSRLQDESGSSAEQLIAAAHAACFSMALSDLLAQAGRRFHSLETKASVTLRSQEGAATIMKIALVTIGRVPGIDELAFVDHALAAKTSCPLRRARAGFPEITLDVSLVP